MTHRKGQMFIVTIVFLVGLVFVVQQALLQYTALDISEPFKTKDFYLAESIVGDIDRMVKGNIECNGTGNSLDKYMEEFESVLSNEYSRGFYYVDFDYSLNCSNWEKTPPDDPPLTITLRIIGTGTETRGTFRFHHNFPDRTPPNIENAQINPSSGPSGTIFTISAEITDPSGVDSTTTIAHIQDPDETDIDTAMLYDDGTHGDVTPNDDVYTGEWDSTDHCPSGSCSYFVDITACDSLGNCREAENI